MRDSGVKLLALLVLALVSGCEGAPGARRADDAYSQASFERWLASDERHMAGYGRFEAFLAERGVAEVVPPWQLLRTDATQAARCGFGAFELPPEEKWPAIVPTLRLVEKEVIPVVGRVEVHSSNRSAELNDCIEGAKRSRHLAFAAVDLIAPERTDKPKMFADLCAMHRRAGAKSRMGLGAYFDPAKPATNKEGRFHIDQSGFRTWGSSYSAASSFCVTRRAA
jgi:hypothetical protein